MTIIVDHPDEFPAACHAEISRLKAELGACVHLAEERRLGLLRLMSESDANRARADELAGALRHLIACWDTEVPSHTLYAAFDNARTWLDSATQETP